MDKSLSRRHFLRGRFFNALKSEPQKQQGLSVIRPPWSVAEHFLQKCTTCNRCVEACEMGILIKGAGGYPEVDFSQGRQECSFCQACVKACEVEGLFNATSQTPWQHKVELQPSCLALNHIECRTCQDSCESRAIRFQRAVGKVAAPTIELERCNGCGACLNRCPSQSIKLRY